MATKKVLINYDFVGNEIINAVLHIAAVAPTALSEGQVYYDSVEKRIRWYDGTQWNSIYPLNDAATTTTNIWSADKIQAAIDAAVAGGVNYQGGYDAGANSPNLDAAPTAGTIEKGFMYTVTADGVFYTENVSIGDVLIAEVDDPASLADWTIVEKNLNTATDTSEGTVELATLAEAQNGTAGALVITADILNQWVTAENVTKKFAVDLDNAEATVVRAFAGGQTTFTVTHSLNSTDVIVQVREIATGEIVAVDETNNGANTTVISFNGNIADNVYRVTIIG